MKPRIRKLELEATLNKGYQELLREALDRLVARRKENKQTIKD